MKNLLLKTLKDFLSVHLKGKGPLLIALSGGEDSSALFSLLLECRFFFSLDLHVAHFDHGWREESSEEAKRLEEYVKSFSLSFHVKRSQTSLKETSNLEDRARRERFGFFQEIYQAIGAEALVIAHQREDQAETILKRIFEGAGLFSLGGMESSSLYEGMNVWRPLLSIERKALQDWNKKRSWTPFQDRTNFDLRFLRPRMREEIFPLIETYFGKNIRKSLFKVGEELSLLKRSFYQKWKPLLEGIKGGILGTTFPFSDFEFQDFFEKQEVVRLFLKQNKVTVSSSVLKKIVSLLDEKASNKELDSSQGRLLLERGSLILIKKWPKAFEGQISLEDELLDQSQLFVEKSSKPLISKGVSLLSCFLQGEISYRIPKEEGSSLSSYDALSKKEQEKISGYLSKNKVPAKIKRIFPFIIKNGKLIDFDFSFNLDLNCEDSTLFSNIILKM